MGFWGVDYKAGLELVFIRANGWFYKLGVLFVGALQASGFGISHVVSGYLDLQSTPKRWPLS